MASVILEIVTIMASVTYDGKCNLCQKLLMASVIMPNVIMANETESF